jgi:mRNA interferase MazF
MLSSISPKQFPPLELFDKWNEEKKYLHSISERKDIFINPGEVWYIKMGINIGFEQNGKKEFRRPVLVIKKIGNMFLCMPLTTK